MKFKHPFTCIVAGPTGSRKTRFVTKLLQNRDTQCTESRFKGGIIWCYSIETAVPSQQLNKLGLNITYQEGLSETYSNARAIRRLSFLTTSYNRCIANTCVICSLKVVSTEILVLYFSRRTFSPSRTLSGHIPERKIFSSVEKRQRQESVYLPSTTGISRT